MSRPSASDKNVSVNSAPILSLGIKQIIGPLLRFAVIFGLLVVPWPGWNEIYGSYFQALGDAVFSRPDEQRVVLFEPHQVQHGFSSLDLQMTLGNRDLADSSGQGLGEIIDLDTRSLGWIPTALTAALILATSVPWKRRGWALLWGMLLIHAFILFSLQVWIWDESPALSLVKFPPFLQIILDDLEYTLLTQLGASFSVPILIWILVTIRREDLFNLIGGKANFPPGDAPEISGRKAKQGTIAPSAGKKR